MTATSADSTFRYRGGGETGTGENSVSVEQVVPGVLDAKASTSVVVGAGYTPVTPTRILGTRNGTGAAKGPSPPAAP
jgi:hypothetical protein